MRELTEREQEIFQFIKDNLRLECHRYAVPSGPTVQLVLCGEIISETSLYEESVDGY